MRISYIIAIVLGFSIDAIEFAKWMTAYIKPKDIPNPSLGIFSVFFLPAYGLSGLIIFHKQPGEIIEMWHFFVIALLIAFFVHLFIRSILPLLFAMICNAYYGRNLLDMGPLPLTKNHKQNTK